MILDWESVCDVYLKNEKVSAKEVTYLEEYGLLSSNLNLALVAGVEISIAV